MSTPAFNNFLVVGKRAALALCAGAVVSLGTAIPADAQRINPPTAKQGSWEAYKQIANAAWPESECAGKLDIRFASVAPESTPDAVAWTFDAAQAACQMDVLEGFVSSEDASAECTAVVHEAGHLARFYDPVGYEGDHNHSPVPGNVMYPDVSEAAYPACRQFETKTTWTQDSLATQAFFKGVGSRNWFADCATTGKGRKHCTLRRRDNGRLIGKYRLSYNGVFVRTLPLQRS